MLTKAISCSAIWVVRAVVRKSHWIYWDTLTNLLISGIWVVRAAARKSLVNNLHVQPSGKRQTQTYSMLGCNNLKKIVFLLTQTIFVDQQNNIHSAYFLNNLVGINKKRLP